MNRKASPAIRRSGKIDIDLPGRQMLDNEIPVYVVCSGIQAVTKLEFSFPYSSRGFQELFPNPLVPRFSAEMLTEGTQSYTSEQIADTLDYYSAEIEKDTDRDKINISISCLNRHLEKILPLLREIIYYPSFPAENLKLLTDIKRQQFILNNEKVNFVAKHNFMRLIYGDGHEYGRTTEAEHFEGLSTEELFRFHSRYFNTTNGAFIIVSGNPEANIVTQLNKYFGTFIQQESHKEGNKERKAVVVSPSNEYIEKKTAVQSAVRIGRVMFNYSHPCYYDFKILNSILGGYFGSRLMTNIREDKGYTYGIGSNLISLRSSGYFFISSQIGVEVCDLAIDEIYKEMERLQQEQVTPEELELVRNYMFGNFLRSIDGPFAYADMCRILIEHKLDREYFQRYMERIENITAAEIMETAQKYLNTSDMSRIVVGKINNNHKS